MLFRRRKTQELDIEDINEAAEAAGTEEELYGDPEEEFYEESEDLYGDLEEESLEEEALPSFDAEETEPLTEPHEKLSPVETGAWEYIHGEPNEDYLTDTGNFRYELDGPEGGVFLPEEEPEDGAEGERRIVHVRRKHKKHHYLLKFATFCVTVALVITFMMSSYFNINEIKVEGMVRYSAEQILTLSELSLGQNIFKTKTGKAEEKIEADPHIAKATIKRDLPKTLVITVEERLPAAQIPYGEDQYAVIDANGYILSVGEADETAAVLAGLTLKGEHITAGTDVKVEEGAVLDETLSLIKAAAAAEISFTKMDMTEKTVRLYITDTLLIKGKPAVILEHIENGDVRMILDDLAAKEITTGTINASGEDTFTFSPKAE